MLPGQSHGLARRLAIVACVLAGGRAGADSLICTWPRFIESGMADRWMAAQADLRWAPSGVPLGGIGGVRVDICRDGRFRNFSMNNNQDAPYADPDGLSGAYLAMTVNGKTTELASRPIGRRTSGVPHLEYCRAFPRPSLRAPAIFPHLDARVTLSGTLIPHDLSTPAFPASCALAVTKYRPHPAIGALPDGLAQPDRCWRRGFAADSGRWYGDGYYHSWDDPDRARSNSRENGNLPAILLYRYARRSYLSSAGEHLLGVAAHRRHGAWRWPPTEWVR